MFIAVFCPLTGLRGQINYGTPYKFTTAAGSASDHHGSSDGIGSAARFYNPPGVAVDTSGNVYVADSGNHTIRKITASGVVTTFAGTAGSPGSSDGTGSAARFNHPRGVAVDSAGTLFVTDVANNTIRRITAAGVVTTFAGSVGNPGSADGTGTAAQFNYPQRLAVDSAGNLYVADTINSTIRKITSGGVVTTLAGSPLAYGSTDGTGSAALFNYPQDVAVDNTGNVYATDRDNHTIRKITSGGVVTTFAGTVGVGGWVDATGTSAKFNFPTGLTVDSSGNIYVGDTYNNMVRKISSAGVVTSLAGFPFSQGSNDGTASGARFYWPSGVAVDAAGNVFVADEFNSTIRKVTSDGVVTTLAGSPSQGSADGPSDEARFYKPTGVAVDPAGNLYIADQQNHTIRKISSGGVVTTLAGFAGVPGDADGIGSAAGFTYPHGVAVDSAGNVYVTDSANQTIRKITSGGVVTTLAGLAHTEGSNDGTGSAARFSAPQGVAVDSSGNVYIADELNHAIRKITSVGVVTTLAGLTGNSGFADGTGSAARFNHPFGVAVDSTGTVYVADAFNHRIRKITSGGTVTTLAGSNGGSVPADGTGTAAEFVFPSGVAVDSAGNVYVGDMGAPRIRRVTSAGVVTTLAGSGTYGSADGAGGTAQFSYSQSGVAVDSAGNLYVTDTGNSTIRRGVAVVRGDFNFDRRKDIVWESTSSGERALWLMNGTVFSSAVSFGMIPTAWRIAAVADFNSDGDTDFLWENTITGERVFWLMNGTRYVSSVSMGVVPPVWRTAAAADFNSDGKPDIVMENTSTGERVVWFMNGTDVVSTTSLGVTPTPWRIVAAADFNQDTLTDLVLENTATGEHAVWLMSGTVVNSSISFGAIPTQWRLATVGDFNGDGDPDFFWENTATGDHALWLMHGTVFSTSIYFGIIPTDWRIAP